MTTTRHTGTVVQFALRWHRTQTRNQLRRLTDEQFAEYERRRVAAQKLAKTYTLHYSRNITDWTATDLNRLTGDMLKALRRCPTPVPSGDKGMDDIGARVYIHFCRRHRDRSDTGAPIDHSLHLSAGYDFSIDCELPTPLPAAAMLEWAITLDPFYIIYQQGRRRRGPELTLREYKPKGWTPRTGRATERQGGGR